MHWRTLRLIAHWRSEDYNILYDREHRNASLFAACDNAPHSRTSALCRTLKGTDLITALAAEQASGARHRTGRQLRDVRCDLARLGKPNLIAVAQDVLHCSPELPEAERLPQDEGMQHERADQ